MKIVLLCGLGILGLAACQETPPPVEINENEIIREVEDMFGYYFQDIKKDGLTAEFTYLDASDDFFWVPPGHTSALSYDSVRTILLENADAFQRIDYHWDRIQINPLSPELAAYTGIVSGALVDTAGLTTQISMTESGVVIKRLDGWRILCGQSAHLPVSDDKKNK